MMHGFYNKLLRVDLSAQSWTVEPIADDIRDMIGWDDLPVIIQGLTGLDLDKPGLQALSARIANTIRRYNLREGMTPADDTLPDRLLREPLQPNGETLSRAELQRMLAEYYALRGWELPEWLFGASRTGDGHPSSWGGHSATL